MAITSNNTLQLDGVNIKLTPFYDRAAAILARGFSTIPLNGKLPLTRNGAQDRSRDPEVIARWAAEFPQANAAIVADDTFMVLTEGNAPGAWTKTPDGPVGSRWICFCTS